MMAACGRFKHVTVIGAGVMGSGIAQVVATAGYKVTLVDLNDKLIGSGLAKVHTSLQRIARKQFKGDAVKGEEFVSGSLGRIEASVDLLKAVAGTDLVIESIVENIQAKHALFRTIDAVAPPTTVFASNTSSLLISEIAAVTKRQDRFGGLHFFNPVPMVKLLEVVRSENTSPTTHDRLLAFGESLGKLCVVCRDTPAFIHNRLLIPAMVEAIRMVERGDASARDIDIAMKLGAGHPVGPLEMADRVGLDTVLHILRGWRDRFPDDPANVPIPLLERMVMTGRLGVKSGEGFYCYRQ